MGFVKEFKEFIMRGNVMDMAVGVIIGGAFSAIVTSLVDDIISPLLGCFGGMDFSELAIPLVGDSKLLIGNFINAVISFLIIALILFAIIKAANAASAKLKKEEEAAPVTKICPFCKSEIHIEAVKCPFCASDVAE